MATPIPNDPLLRKTFTYEEQNWHTEHNRNWTQTVTQLNTVDETVTIHESRLSLAEQNITGLGDDLATVEAAVAERVSAFAYKQFLKAVGVATVTTAASAGAETLVVNSLKTNLDAGARLQAYIPETLTTVHVIVAADATQGAGVLSVSALSGAIPADTPLLWNQNYLYGEATTGVGSLVTIEGEIDNLEGDISNHYTLITQNADAITALAQRVTAEENLTTSFATQIQQTADELLLRASKSVVDDLSNRMTSAEASITVTSDSITSVIESVDVNNTLINANRTAIAQVKDAIALTASRTTTTEKGLVNLEGELIVTNERIDSSVTRIDDVEGVLATTGTQISQLSDQVALSATKTEALDLSSATAICELASVHSGTVTALTTTGTLTPLFDNDVLVIVAPNGEKESVSVNKPGIDNNGDGYADNDSDKVALGVTSIPVTSSSLDKPAGSKVYLAPWSYRSEIRVRYDSIKLEVEGKLADGDSATSLTLDLDGITVDADRVVSKNFDGTIGANGVVSDRGNAGWALTESGEVVLSNAFIRGKFGVGSAAPTDRYPFWIGDDDSYVRVDTKYNLTNNTYALQTNHLDIVSHGTGASRFGLRLYPHNSDVSASEWWIMFHEEDANEIVFNYTGSNKFYFADDQTIYLSDDQVTSRDRLLDTRGFTTTGQLGYFELDQLTNDKEWKWVNPPANDGTATDHYLGVWVDSSGGTPVVRPTWKTLPDYDWKATVGEVGYIANKPNIPGPGSSWAQQVLTVVTGMSKVGDTVTYETQDIAFYGTLGPTGSGSFVVTDSGA